MQMLLSATEGLVSIGITSFVLQLAIILLSTKMLGMLMRKLGLPQVLGFILAGVLFGPTLWEYIIGETSATNVFPISETWQLDTFAKIGVILILFTAGLETDLKELKNTGKEAILVAMGGVLVPLLLGFVVGIAFFGTNDLLSSLFMGVILTATSVGITVETLRELGKLKSRTGTVILSAAIIDDVIGIVVLSIVISLKSGGVQGSNIVNSITGGNAVFSILWMFVFFVFAIGAGVGISYLFKYFEKHKPNVHRVPILSLVVCFVYSYVAEEIFGVADITGAYIAGVMLSTNHKTAEYADQKIGVSSYVMFAPIFFFNIGRQIIFESISLTLLAFTFCFILAGIIGKLLGCGCATLAFKQDRKDWLKVGAGMVARGEVALIVAQKGITSGLLPPEFITVTVLFVFVTSVLAPIMLKLLYKKDDNNIARPLDDGLSDIT